MNLSTRAGNLDLSKGPLLMGILNVTPDSFTDGGRFTTVETALARAEEMGEEGAAIIDVGGESTRPGADPVSLDVELKRVIPVVQILASRLPSLPLSVDTSKAEVARQALEEGASIVNDVSALNDPWMPVVLRDHDAPVVLMHRQGDPRTMQDNPGYTDVVKEIIDFFHDRLAFAESKGIQRHRILLDPGIGFGKTTAHNLQILKRLPELAALGYPLLIGLSQKTFIGRILGREDAPLPVSKRAEGSLAAHLWAAAHGAHILRVHDVRATAQAFEVWRRLEMPPSVDGGNYP
jgi:dihydropteroate synthase